MKKYRVEISWCNKQGERRISIIYIAENTKAAAIDEIDRMYDEHFDYDIESINETE